MSRMSLWSNHIFPGHCSDCCFSTGDEIPAKFSSVRVDFLDSLDGPPYTSIKIFYRPGGKLVALFRIPYQISFQNY